jgi:hypothetical protein
MVAHTRTSAYMRGRGMRGCTSSRTWRDAARRSRTNSAKASAAVRTTE